MNRQALIKMLTEYLDIRVWQAIRNLSGFSFIYASNDLPPTESDFGEDGRLDYYHACAEFCEGLKDTFYMEDTDA